MGPNDTAGGWVGLEPGGKAGGGGGGGGDTRILPLLRWQCQHWGGDSAATGQGSDPVSV